MPSAGSRLSLIATTYNQPRDLEFFLHTVCAQNTNAFEVLIADDGSGSETKSVIEKYQAILKERLVHVWHKDDGYRKATVVNAAVRRSQGEWLVFVDTDCLLHERFIQDHFSQARSSGLFMGRRTELGPHFSQWLRQNPNSFLSPTFYSRLLWSGLKSESKNTNRSFRVGNKRLSKLLKYDRVPDLLGSNFSIDRTLFEKINGFNEDLKSYWGEDGDLFIRARNSGAKIVGRKAFAVQFHLWHERRAVAAGNEEKYYERLKSDFSTMRCKNGLKKLS